MAITSLSPRAPEDLESIAHKKFKEGNRKEGIKVLIQAGKKYEESGKLGDAARVFKQVGLTLLSIPALKDKAKPFLLKSASLYLDLISVEIEKPEVDLLNLENFCTNVLDNFTLIGDAKNLERYAREFAKMYEELGESYLANDELDSTIVSYEAAYRYYKMIHDEEGIKAVASKLIDIYGKISEEHLASKDYENAARVFERIGFFVKDIFGYDAHFTEMLETAGKNYETASKLAYAEGNLEKMVRTLVEALYAYLLGNNMNRAKLIGINTSRMLNQLINSHRSSGEYHKVYEEIMLMAVTLVGVGKLKEAIKLYREILQETPKLEYKIRIREAMLKYLASTKKSVEILEALDQLRFYFGRGDLLRAFDIAERVLEASIDEDILKKLYEAEGITNSF